MDIETMAPVDDLEALFAEDEDELLGDAAPTTNPSNNPLLCGA